MFEVFYLLRYLAPKESGKGKIVAAISTDNITLKQWKQQDPHLFEDVGFYSLMKSTGETTTVEPEKEK
jgi:hypothetical protein